MVQVGLDYTLFIQIVQFLLIVLVANFLILKPIKKTMDARNDKINNLLANADSSTGLIEAGKAEYDKKLADIRTSIGDYQRKMKEEADVKAHEILKAAEAEVSKSIEKSRSDIEKAINEARQGLEKEVADISGIVRKTILGNVA